MTASPRSRPTASSPTPPSSGSAARRGRSRRRAGRWGGSRCWRSSRTCRRTCRASRTWTGAASSGSSPTPRAPSRRTWCTGRRRCRAATATGRSGTRRRGSPRRSGDGPGRASLIEGPFVDQAPAAVGRAMASPPRTMTAHGADAAGLRRASVCPRGGVRRPRDTRAVPGVGAGLQRRPGPRRGHREACRWRARRRASAGPSPAKSRTGPRQSLKMTVRITTKLIDVATACATNQAMKPGSGGVPTLGACSSHSTSDATATLAANVEP